MHNKVLDLLFDLHTLGGGKTQAQQEKGVIPADD